MKSSKVIYLRALPPVWLAVLLAVVSAGCKRDSDDNPGGGTDKSDATENHGGVILDAETQTRIGLAMGSPVPAQWQPEAKGYGQVIDPASFTSDVADLESARVAADASRKEYERQKTLAEQNNASARALEDAQAAATHDQLAVDTALAKFKLNWGSALANQSDTLQADITAGQAVLVRIDLPAGEILATPPTSARVTRLGDESQSVDTDFIGVTDGVNAQTQNRSYFFLAHKSSLVAGAAITGYMKIPGEPLGGVLVPSAAVVRYEGEGWVYEQTASNAFARVEIPLDRLEGSNWFVPGNLAATNRIVVTGAQTVLSAELSNGGFTTGERD